MGQKVIRPKPPRPQKTRIYVPGMKVNLPFVTASPCAPTVPSAGQIWVPAARKYTIPAPVLQYTAGLIQGITRILTEICSVADSLLLVGQAACPPDSGHRPESICGDQPWGTVPKGRMTHVSFPRRQEASRAAGPTGQVGLNLYADPARPDDRTGLRRIRELSYRKKMSSDCGGIRHILD